MIDECIFCKLAKREIPRNEIYENDNFFSVPDLNPLVEGHSLIIPKKHFDTLLDLVNSLGPELLDCIKKTTIVLMKQYKADGFNVISNNFEAAGQIVKHVHFHILPRKKGDGLKVIG